MITEQKPDTPDWKNPREVPVTDEEREEIETHMEVWPTEIIARGDMMEGVIKLLDYFKRKENEIKSNV